jgi:flagellar biosynthesis/type III secretory pathway protein FliH
LPLSVIPSNSFVTYLTFTVGGGADGLYFSLYDSSSGYFLGYEDGYDIGYDNAIKNSQKEIEELENDINSAYDKGYTEGKTVGYDLGVSDGFQDGFNQTQNGGFTWLISSVQAFLDVNFFGDFGIGTLLFVGLGMTLVTLFLKMFAGG